MIFTETVTLETLNCINCAATFALNANWIKQKRTSGGGFHCPYCQHSQGWWKSRIDKLKEELDQKQKELTAAKCDALAKQHLVESGIAANLQLQKKLTRVKNGVCPCCNRTFQNLARHMETKHKELTQK